MSEKGDDRFAVEIDFGSDAFGDASEAEADEATAAQGTAPVFELSDSVMNTDFGSEGMGDLNSFSVPSGSATPAGESESNSDEKGVGSADFGGLTLVLQDSSEHTATEPGLTDVEKEFGILQPPEHPQDTAMETMGVDLALGRGDETDGQAAPFLTEEPQDTSLDSDFGSSPLQLNMGESSDVSPNSEGTLIEGASSCAETDLGGFNLPGDEGGMGMMLANGELSMQAESAPIQAPKAPNALDYETSGGTLSDMMPPESVAEFAPPSSMPASMGPESEFSVAAAVEKTTARRKGSHGSNSAQIKMLVAVVLVGVVGVGGILFWDDIRPLLMGEGEMAAAPFDGGADPSAPVGQISSPTPSALGAEAVKNSSGESVVRPGANSPRFEAIERAIVAGNPLDAIREFKVKLDAPVSAGEEIVVAALKARYFLLVSRARKAVETLAPHCAKVTKSNLNHCVHFVRSLIAVKEYRKADILLKQMQGVTDLQTTRVTDEMGMEGVEVGAAAERPFGDDRVLILLATALRSLSQPTYATGATLAEQVLTEFNVDAEWYRQRGVWFARAIMAMSNQDRARMILHLFGRKRKDLTRSLDNAAQAGLLGADPMLVPFLNFLASRHGIDPLDIQAPSRRFDTDQTMMSYIFGILERSNRKPMNAETGTNALLGREPYSDFVRLLALHAAMRDEDWNSAYQVFVSYLGGKKRLEYEWMFAAGMLSVHFGAKKDARTLLRQFDIFAQKQPMVANDFYHWILISALRRTARVPNDKSIAQADSLSVGKHEKAVLAVERSETIATEGQIKDAVDHLIKEMTRNKHNPFLARQTRRMIERLGADPAKHVDTSRFSDRDYFRNFGMPVMSDYTIRSLLEAL